MLTIVIAVVLGLWLFGALARWATPKPPPTRDELLGIKRDE